MAVAAAGGGGGGAATIAMDSATMTAVEDGLTRAAETFDAAGGSRPSTGGTGLAEPLLVTILTRACETASRVAFESDLLAGAVADCAGDAGSTDAANAEAMLTEGTG